MLTEPLSSTVHAVFCKKGVPKNLSAVSTLNPN